MVLTAKEESVRIYLKSNTSFPVFPGRGTYVPSIERIDKHSRNGFYIKIKELESILNKLKIYERIEKLKQLNDAN